MTRQRVSLFFIGLGVLIGIGLLILATAPIPATQTTDNGTYRADRAFLLRADMCTTVSWDFSNIEAIYFQGDPSIGSDTREVCLNVSDGALRVVVEGVETTYTPPVTILLQTVWVWGLAAVAFLSLLIGGLIPLLSLGGGNAYQQISTGLVTAGLMLLVMFLMLEGTMRAWFAVTGSERDKLIYLADSRDIAEANSLIMPLPHVSYGIIPKPDDTNALGYRNGDITIPKPDDTYRIVALGGSTTHGWISTRDEAYPAVMENHLHDTYGYDQTEVINAGVPTYTAIHSSINLQTRVAELEPDMVILYHAVNDTILRWTVPECYRGMNPLRGLGDVGVWNYEEPNMSSSVFVRYLQIQLGFVENPSNIEWRLSSTGACEAAHDIATVDHLQVLEQNPPIYFERAVENVILHTQARGIELLLVTQPLRYDVFDADSDLLRQSIAVGQREHNDIVRDLAAEYDVMFFDFDEWMSDNSDDPALWEADAIHLSVAGLAVQGEQFAQFLDEQGILEN